MLTQHVPIICKAVVRSAPPTVIPPLFTTYFDETWPGVATEAIPAGWTVTGGTGTFTQQGDGTVISGGSPYAIRDIGVSDYVLTGTVRPIINGFQGLLFGCNASVTSSAAIMWDFSQGDKLIYFDETGTGNQTSDTTYPSSNPPSTNYLVEITKSGTTMSVKVNGSTVLFSGASSFTVPAGLANTYVGFIEAGTFQGIFGEIKATS